MIPSSHTIDFITAAGTRRLVSSGEMIDQEISPRVSQKSTDYSAIGAAWCETQAEGGAKVSLAFTVRQDHASHATLRGWVMRAAATFPSGATGTLRLAITGGETWDILSATIASSDPTPYMGAGWRTLTSYAISGGEMLPYGPVTLYAGIPWQFINQDWEDLTEAWETL